MSFYSGRFSATEIGSSTVEKEGYAVIATIDRTQWLVSCSDGFESFTDHNNLIFIFGPSDVKTYINVAAPRKVLRWALLLSTYK